MIKREWLDSLKPGDQVTRFMDGFGGKLCENDATVFFRDENLIICIVYVDVPRKMQFYASDGVSILGREYGWLGKKREGETGEALWK